MAFADTYRDQVALLKGVSRCADASGIARSEHAGRGHRRKQPQLPSGTGWGFGLVYTGQDRVRPLQILLKDVVEASTAASPSAACDGE